MESIERTALTHAGVSTHYLASVLQATAARGAVLFIEDPSILHGGPLLVAAGNTEKIPELADPETAVVEIANLDIREPGNPEPPIIFFQSHSELACLLRISVRCGAGKPVTAVVNERRSDSPECGVPQPSPCVWIGLEYGSSADIDGVRGVAEADANAPGDHLAWMAHTLTMGANLVWEVCQMERLLRDPTSQLPGRAEFQSRLKAAFQDAKNTDQPLGLLLINPDEFGAVNERLDRESGDRAVAELAQLLRASLRQTDRVFRYGGAVFAALLPKADAHSVEVVTEKVRQALTGAYLDGAVRLNFSVGAVVYQSSVEEDAKLDGMGLLRRADHALNLAKRAGGDCSMIWNRDEAELPKGGVDRLSGIFTADAEKDYRNMLLLWDTIAVLSCSAEKEQVASQFVNLVSLSLKPSRIALVERAGDGFQCVAVAQRSDAAGTAEFKLSATQQGLVDKAHRSLSAESIGFEGRDPVESLPAPFVCHAIPILADKKCLGCLYIDGPAVTLRLDSSDLIFLDALAGQLGLVLDRVALAERWREETERESKRLREEVQDLRQVLHSAKLIYSSQQMHTVLDTLRAVASTDVTILIDGESGTGKEMLARAVHDLSERKDKPLVIVDCGAIAHNLMEAELFGYVKGAYTGAHGSSKGRIAQAEGGTLFLDEVGEIPLDVQAKLLRFVQEKEINPVGATKSTRVDTRIVAATNRDLGREAAAGRFREDLYYRLKVVTVTAPPLRKRPDDILPLARHFLDKFALQYEKKVRRFEPDTETCLQQYQWPGNVRELQNCILRAVVLCEQDAIPVNLLQLGEDTDSALKDPEAERDSVQLPPSGTFQDYAEKPADPWLTLEHELGEQVEYVLSDATVAAVPLGRWLMEDLVREADKLFDGNCRRASAELGMAETTYRRQLDKVKRIESQGLLARTPNWTSSASVLTHLVKSIRQRAGENVAERARSLLLAEVSERVPGNDGLGAALMGVTVPTYKRWKQVPRRLNAVASV